MSPPASGANPRGPTYAGRASPRPSPPLPLESKSGSVRQRIAAATHHGGDEIAAQPRPRYVKMAPPALTKKNQRTSSVPVAGRTASYARPPPQRASVRKPSITAAACAITAASGRNAVCPLLQNASVLIAEYFALRVGLLRGSWARRSSSSEWTRSLAAAACEGGGCALRCGWPGIFQAFGSDCPDGGGARREMVAAASSLLGAPSLRRMCETWTLTVLTLMTSAAAISRLV